MKLKNHAILSLAILLAAAACGGGEENNGGSNNGANNGGSNNGGSNNGGSNNGGTNNGGTNNGGTNNGGTNNGGTNNGGTNNGGTNNGGTNNGGTNNGGTNNGTNAMTTSVMIVAADGGEVSLGGATLSIPAGALAADTEITLSVSAPDASTPGFDSIEGMVFDFGPDGTQFVESVTLSLPIGAGPGAGESMAVSWLAGDQWLTLPSNVQGDTVVAPIRHFTSFAATLHAGDVLETCGFTACGGDPVGMWTLDSICTGAPLGENGLCPAGEGWTAQQYRVSGTVDMRADGTFDQAITFGVGGFSYFSGSCLTTLNMASGFNATNCDEVEAFMVTEIYGGQGAVSCTGDFTNGCLCDGENLETLPVMGSGTWSAAGDLLTVTDANGTNETPFCATANTLSVDYRALQFGVANYVK